MPRITKETQERIRNLFLKIKLRQDIPEILFASPAVDCLYSELGCTAKTKKMIRYLESKRLVKKTDGKYELTDFGKFAYLMNKFGVSFLELCFLLETYHYEERMRQTCRDGFYLKYSFYDKVEDIISYGTLSNTITRLSKRGLVHRHHKASYSTTPETFTELARHREIITRFHDWFIDTWREKNRIITQDSLVSQRRKEYSDIYQKTVLL